MYDYDLAYSYIVSNEGGFSNHPKDMGGATKSGISLSFLKQMFSNGSLWVDLNKDNVIDENDIILLSEEQIKNIYKVQFWNPVSKLFPFKLAVKVFDAGVNIGVRQAIILLQRLLNVVADGIIGNITLSALKKYTPDNIIKNYVDSLVDFYQKLVLKNPSQSVFLKGWLSRARRLPPYNL